MQKRQKNPKGKVGIESFRDTIRLRLPRHLFEGKQKYIYLGLPDTDINRKFAESKARVIEDDILKERFDYTLEKYTGKAPPQLTVVQTIRPSLSIQELWQRFYTSKKSELKAKTQEKYENFTRLFEKLGDRPLEDAIAIKQKLTEITTTDRTRDALTYLNAAAKWGLKHGLVNSNPFDGMAQAMPKPNYMTDPKPDAFSEEEMHRVIQAFRNDNRPGMSYRHYAPFVEFLFKVGCRPSEAVALTWGDISPDCGTVRFTKSFVQIGNRRVQSEGSKNNRTRALALLSEGIAISQSAQSLLLTIRPEKPEPTALVFPSPVGDSINYRNFARRAWTSIVDPIKPDTTPYSCRDTFITTQLLKGTPSSVIAKWCDTSTQMIDRHYADQLKLTQLRPTE